MLPRPRSELALSLDAELLHFWYEERHVLEIILAIAVKTLSNYSNHLFHTPLDETFASREWKKSA